MIKTVYRKIFSQRFRDNIKLIFFFFKDRKKFEKFKETREHNVHYGKMNDKIHFFVIRRDPHATGLLACYLCAFGQLISKEKKINKGKLFPVMDMMTQYYALAHKNENEVMKVNAWEYYFEQFSTFSMKDVYKSKNVTLSNAGEVASALIFFHNNVLDRDTVRKYLPIHNKFFRLTNNLEQLFEESTKKMFGDKRVLGTNIREGYIVLANGRDNNEDCYANYNVNIKGHPVQPNIDELCKMLEEKMRIWKCDYLFAECETTFIDKYLKNYFGDMYISSSHKKREVENLTLEEYLEASKKLRMTQNVLENNIEYLKSIFLLSKCTSLYASKCSGTVVACFWNNDKYENMDIIDKGVY